MKEDHDQNDAVNRPTSTDHDQGTITRKKDEQVGELHLRATRED